MDTQFRIGDVVTHVRKGDRGVIKEFAAVERGDVAAVVWADREPSWPLVDDLRLASDQPVSIIIPAKLAESIRSCTFREHPSDHDRQLFDLVQAALTGGE